MAHSCFCGETFPTPRTLDSHRSKSGHNIQCSCGKLFEKFEDVEQHRGHKRCKVYRTAPASAVQASSKPTASVKTTSRAPVKHCPICGKKCASEDGVKAHIEVKHLTSAGSEPSHPCPATIKPSTVDHDCPVCGQKCANEKEFMSHMYLSHQGCPACGRIFGSHKQREHHQRATGHCYCKIHDVRFGSLPGFQKHNRKHDHAIAHECMDCERSFDTSSALTSHLSSARHRSVVDAIDKASTPKIAARAAEDEKLRCEECKRDFKESEAYQQHMGSTRHKPVDGVVCPRCQDGNQYFKTPRALRLHWESGKCKSTTDHLELTAEAYHQDEDPPISRSVAAICDAAIVSVSSIDQLVTGLAALRI